MTGSSAERSAAARAVIDAVTADLLGAGHRGVIVDSPPGAGKSTLVVELAGRLADTGEPVMVVAQTNEQVDDLVDRLAAAHGAPGSGRGLTIGRLSASGYVPTQRVARHTGGPHAADDSVTVAGKVADLGAPAVTVATAAKWARTAQPERPAGGWRWAILDEAYQMRSDGLLAIAPRFADGTALFVGDPGQLDPFATIDGERWAGSPWDPTDSAVAVVRAHNPRLPVHRLPYSWRLPATAAPLVCRAFYPFTPFEAGSAPQDRAMKLPGAATVAGPADSGPIDQALDLAAETGWALYELPARHTVRTDTEAVDACARLAARLVRREASVFDPGYPGGRPVTADRVAIGAAHRDQAAGIRAALDRHGADLAAVTVDTANRLQGREYDVCIVLHPLSGRRDATAFHLETGRLCVLLSRHRHACIVVSRAGIPELLDAHPHTEPVHLGVPVKFPDGWEAHQAVLAHLGGHRVTAAR
ncbi:AAA family ATPase [Actinocrinis puniceicyclus]|uniref:AAA family ATPase n=1 Tax=Actinocrinis puniceicyclus TaxID=977794 RepID=A0A8J7WK27_9ACTN|nr:AAA domain-containing protein [Actinocrinis puniceicyclus]MBS2963736.1 AAA family ATPase [Actinocrinis puniceicyclus]